MPVYEYHCKSCGADFSRTEKISEHGSSAVACPKCQGAEVERVISAAYAKTARKS